LSSQKMTPKRWLIAGASSLLALFLLQRFALLGLVGLERLLIRALVTVEEALLAGLFAATKSVGLVAGAAAAVYAVYLFVFAEDTSKPKR